MATLAQLRAQRKFARASKAMRRKWARKAARTRARHSHVTGLSRKHQSLCYTPSGETVVSECRDFASNPYGRYWRNIKSDDIVKDVGSSYVVVSKDGEQITAFWMGHDAADAQKWLRQRASKDKSKPHRKSRNPELLAVGLNPTSNPHYVEGEALAERRFKELSRYGPMLLYKKGKTFVIIGAHETAAASELEIHGGYKRVSKNPELLAVGLNPIGRSGMQVSQGKLKKNYQNFDEFEYYSEMYGLANRLGYKSAKAAWDANPTIQWGVHPMDFRRVKSKSKNPAGGSSMSLGALSFTGLRSIAKRKRKASRRKSRRRSHRRPKMRCRRVRRRNRSWRAFVRKHRGVMKRLGLKRGIRKIAHMWKRAR